MGRRGATVQAAGQHQVSREGGKHDALLRSGGPAANEIQRRRPVLGRTRAIAARPPQPAQFGLDDRRSRPLVDRQQRGQPSRENLVRLVLARAGGGDREAEQQVGPVMGRAVRGERKCLSVEPDGRGRGIHGARPLGRFDDGSSGIAGKNGRVLAGCARELQRAHVVVRQHLGVLVRAPEQLDPSGGRGMLPGPHRARDLSVSDVAQQDVEERVLRLAGDRGLPLAADELLALQAM